MEAHVVANFHRKVAAQLDGGGVGRIFIFLDIPADEPVSAVHIQLTGGFVLVVEVLLHEGHTHVCGEIFRVGKWARGEGIVQMAQDLMARG